MASTAGNAVQANFRHSAQAHDLGDVGAQLGVVVPLPLSRRHTLRLLTRGRALIGVTDDQQRLLEIGGVSDLSLYQSNENVSLPDSRLPISFAIPLRGYEGASFLDNRVITFELTYRYPLIVDRGTASTLYALPGFFVADFVVEGFASRATIAHSAETAFDDDLHGAVGTSLAMNFSLWALSAQLRYQLARRLTDDEATAHLVTLGLPL
ncbi:MAG: hypothetical protein MJE77_34840 [Proteobacteria bacterium]|nr:hypothetical protein [Pseudomonadota bacterium]